MLEKNKPYTVKITETAWEMLISHARFLANVSIPAANRLIDTFVEITDSLAAMPERNPWLEHDAIPFRKYHKLLFGKHYMALYQIQENTVYVTAVMDCRQDYIWLL
jgi:plasmid stabilization system protein ParE